MEQYLKQGLMPDSKVLDIRQVDVSTGRFLEDNTPVFVITFTTQEVLLFRDRKTRDVAVGAENRVEQCNYAAVITRVEEELENELTGGWKVIEVGPFFPLSFVLGITLMTRGGESRWRVGRGAHIYDLASPSLLPTATATMRFAPPKKKKRHSLRSILFYCKHNSHDTLSSHHYHHHSRDTYRHIY
jgi:Tim44-like domain